MKLKKVLLIDDDDTVNFINRKLIEKSALAEEIVVQRSVLTALEVLRSEVGQGQFPELIFVDINMPEMDGWEFVDKYSALGKGTSVTKIILLTSLIDPADTQRAETISAISAFKEKPVSLEMLGEIENEMF